MIPLEIPLAAPKVGMGTATESTPMTLTDITSATPTDRTRGRNGTIDLLRLLAAAIIVLFHARAPGGLFMTPAVAAFTAILAYNACRSEQRAGSSASRIRRFLQPFAVWVGIFVVLRSLDALLSGEPVAAALTSWFPPFGTMHHLWFLPFGFAVASLAPAVLRALRLRLGNPGALCLLVLLAVGWLVLWESLELPQGVRIFGLYLPSALLGMALTLVPLRPVPLFLAFLACLLGGLVLRELAVNNSAQIFLGLPVVIAALLFPMTETSASRLAAALSLAVYLIHPLIMAVVLRLTPLASGSGALGLAVLSLSLAGGVIILNTPLRRWLL